MTTPSDEIQWSLRAEDAKTVRRELEAFKNNDFSELEIGKRIVAVRPLLETMGEFQRFIRAIPSFSERTAYRRIKSYERAVEMWPEAVIDAAIVRGLQVIGWEADKPMGFYEDVPLPPKPLTPQKIEDFLIRAEQQVRLRVETGEGLSFPDLLKTSFKMFLKQIRSLPVEEREPFLKELVGLQMTVVGVSPQKFAPAMIPTDFWTAGVRSPETRARISRSAAERWKRVKEAKAAQLKKRA
jgi:hypothetical protein